MPHTSSIRKGASVQQGLSAAGGALGFYRLGLAADKRHSFKLMQLHTDLTRRDFFLARTFLFFRPGFNLWVAIAFAIGIPAFNSADLLFAGGLGSAVFVLLCLVSFVFYSVFVLAFSAFELLVTAAPKRGVLGKHDLTLTPEGLVEQTSFNRTVHPWQSVDCLLRRPGMILIRAGAGWHLIPRRAISANTNGSEFVRALEAKITGAQA